MMQTITLTVSIATDGDAHEIGDILAQYLTLPDHPFLTDYKGGERDDGYNGPYVREITVRSAAHNIVRRWKGE